MNDLGAPWMLLLLALVPLLVLLRYRLKRRAVLRFSDGSVLQGLRPSWAVRCWPIVPVLYALGLASLVVALARPRTGLEESIVRTEAVDIILLVDVSTSMRALDFSTAGRQKDRLMSAQEVLHTFIERRTSDRLGLVAFAALPYSVSPLTLDHNWLRQQVDRLNTEMLEDGTAIGSALASAVDRLRDSEAESKLVILLTDGENNAGSMSPENAAQAAKAMGVKVYTIGAGTDGYVNIPVQTFTGSVRYRKQLSRIDETTLKEIADITGGRFFRATDSRSLDATYEEIDELEKTVIDVENYTQYEERFAVFVLAGIVCLGAERVLALGRLGRSPA